jgi:hypothetical protein
MLTLKDYNYSGSGYMYKPFQSLEVRWWRGYGKGELEIGDLADPILRHKWISSYSVYGGNGAGYYQINEKGINDSEMMQGYGYGSQWGNGGGGPDCLEPYNRWRLTHGYGEGSGNGKGSKDGYGFSNF